MADTRMALGLGLFGLAGYLYWKRSTEIDTANAQATAQANAVRAGEATSGSCTSGFLAEMAAAWKQQPPASASNAAAMVKTIGASATAVAGAINPIAGAVVGVVSTIAAAVFPMFQGKPLDPVREILIQEQPYNYVISNEQTIKATNDNTISGATIYALDACGYLHPLQNEVNAAGYSYRDIIAVNWEILSMLPQLGTPITNVSDLVNAKIDMPRPADAGTLRAVFGNDILFKLGTDNTVHGPWEAGANVPPLPGSPAEWVKIAGTYEPTQTEVEAGSWG